MGTSFKLKPDGIISKGISATLKGILFYAREGRGRRFKSGHTHEDMIHEDTITFKFKIGSKVWYLNGSYVSSGIIKARRCIQNDKSLIEYSLSASNGFLPEKSLFSSREDLAKAITNGVLDCKS